MAVCFDTSRKYARWALGLRTVDIAVSPVWSARMLFCCEFWTTKKKPTRGLKQHKNRCKKIFTADDNPKQYTYNEVEGCHKYHDWRDCDIFQSVDPMSCVPKGFLYEINTKDENKRAHDNDRWEISLLILTDMFQNKINSRMYAIGPVPMKSSNAVATARRRPATRVPPPTR
jgi:hypothetical protein